MDAIFALGNRASVEDIRTRLIDSPSYSATRTMVTRLEEKGFVRHEADGNRYLYSATVSPATAKRHWVYIRTLLYERLQGHDPDGAAEAES